MGKAEKLREPQLRIGSEVLQQIRQHARSNKSAEVCGVLIGTVQEDAIAVTACIRGLNAEQGGAHVTFTQDTWAHIYKIKDAEYPDERILGWYHSHPGFGVFLSDHDTFIHKNFFSAPQQVAWVYDPISDEEGCFGWIGERLQRLARIAVADGKGGEGAGETGKSEPIIEGCDDEESAGGSGAAAKNSTEKLLRLTCWIFLGISILLLGGLGGWLLAPRQEVLIPVPVDPQTGQVLHLPQYATQDSQQQPGMQQPGSAATQPGAAGAQPSQPWNGGTNSGTGKGSNEQRR
jgi:proteasome lid subunit RPN8/RPN11